MTSEAGELVAQYTDLIAPYLGRRLMGRDECLGPDGTLKPSWVPFFKHLQELRIDELNARDSLLDRRVVELGLAHDIFSDPGDDVPGWDVNLIPVIFDAAEWRWLSSAVQQRLRLSNAIVEDLYGDKVSLRQRLVPADIILSDPTYLHACDGIQPPSGHIHFLAVDVARRNDGSWRLIDIHTETLAGLGYALANRLVYTHAAEDVFAATKALRLAPFFRSVLAALAPGVDDSDRPRVALLTQGPQHPDYFSHAYIARYLNLHLVEGNDMRTVNDQVFLKTLEGLKPIDGLIRCVEGAASDAMELSPTGFDGPVGLVQACRKSPDLVRNSLGAAVVQNRALGTYMPELCRAFLNEDLILADTPRHWLGGIDPLSSLHAMGPGVVVRRVQEGTGRPGETEPVVHYDELTPEAREQLLSHLRFDGAAYVAEAPIELSHCPTFLKGSLASEPVVVRLFAAMTANGPEVMPGGLAISVGKQTQVGQDPVRGRTRDVWVLGDREAKSSTHQSLWRNTTAVARVQRSQRSLQSRVADDLFWLGRYAERADWTMRVLRSSLLKLLDDDGKLDKSGIVQSPLDPVRVSMGLLLSKSAAPGSPPVYDLQNDSIGQLSGLLIHNRGCLYALAPTLDHVVRYAELTRDRLSFEAWTVLTSLRSGQPWRRLLETANVETLVDLLEDGLTVIASFNGLMQENMTRNHGWTFLSMGRRLERAYNLSDIMLALFQSPESEEAEWSAMLMLLEVADSYITYRSRYRLDPMFPLVVDLLLLDDTNPRSLFFQFEQIDRHLASLPLAQSPPSQSAKRRLILEAIDELRAIDPIEMAGDPSRNAFRDLLQSKLNMLPELSDAIGRRYFSLLEDKPHRAVTRSSGRR